MYLQQPTADYHRRLAGLQLVKIYDIFLITFLAFLLSTFTYADDDDEPTSSASTFSEPFVEQTTGLTMERFFGARTQFGFAFALPEDTSSTSFIGQLTFPLVNGQGWGSFGLTGDMEGNFILAAWPDGQGGVMASFRQATDEDNPPEVTGSFAVRPLADGVAANQTSLSFTFLCENCLDPDLGTSIDASGNAVMGWALSEKNPFGDATDAGAFLDFHERGFGPFTARLGASRSAQFDAVAATALEPVSASGNAVSAVAGVFEEGDDDDDDEDDGDDDDDDDD
ncbi:iron reductase domain protein [Periconia macrospinosa]|uniref:Iron reductase domain protein n=1 Tax=Periconia macrospinosa TaxID=97972 RepID=A0A2V1DWS3_9PLEO|nr:iron reductase domain protein [Periconia macrospinosa]